MCSNWTLISILVEHFFVTFFEKKNPSETQMAVIVSRINKDHTFPLKLRPVSQIYNPSVTLLLCVIVFIFTFLKFSTVILLLPVRS